jgi:hypothetical protein
MAADSLTRPFHLAELTGSICMRPQNCSTVALSNVLPTVLSECARPAERTRRLKVYESYFGPWSLCIRVQVAGLRAPMAMPSAAFIMAT